MGIGCIYFDAIKVSHQERQPTLSLDGNGRILPGVSYEIETSKLSKVIHALITGQLAICFGKKDPIDLVTSAAAITVVASAVRAQIDQIDFSRCHCYHCEAGQFLFSLSEIGFEVRSIVIPIFKANIYKYSVLIFKSVSSPSIV